MANTLKFKRGLVAGIPTAALGEPLFTTDTFDLYIGNGTSNTRFQKYIASGATTQILRGDGSLYTFPLAISSPTNGQVLKYNGTSWVNDTDLNTGTVTSVAMTVPTGLSVSGSPITSSGTLAVTFASGYSIPTDTKQGQWDTAYTNRITSLTTTGSSGAATLISNTLNIPNYTLSGLGGVPTSRTLTINGTGYDLSTDRSWSVGTITSLTGEASASGTGAVTITLDNASVIGKVLTGLNLTGGGTIASTDTILQAFGKVQNQISAMVGGVTYQGTWNASTNTPTLTSSVGTKGYYYVVATAGSTNLNGITDWKIGDWVIFNGSTWDKVDNTDAVSSVNGYTGAVSLSTSDIGEGTNLYFTNTRAQNAITLTTSGTSGASTYTSGTLNIPAYSLSGLGGVPTSRTLTINGTAFDLSADRSWSVGTVTSVAISVPTGLTVSGTPITSSGTFSISLQSGYSIPTTAKQTEWDTAYTNRITSLTTTGSSGAATLVSNTLNIPNYTLSGLGGVPTSRTITINGTTLDLSADRSWSVGTVTSVAALTIGTTGTDLSSTVANDTTTPVITLNVPTASATNRGALSSTDWSTFNSKQPQLNGTGFVKASGTTITYDNSTYLTTSSASSTYLPLAGGTLTGQLISTQANSPTTGGGQIYLNGTTGNRIDFNINGTGAPAFTTRSVGTKIVLYPDISATKTDYAIGIENGYLWNSVPTLGDGFKWYASNILALSLTGGGAATFSSSVTAAGTVQATALYVPFKSIATSNTLYNEYYANTSTLVGSIGNGNGIVSGGGDATFGVRAETDLIFASGGNNRRMTLNSSGNLGLGVTPSAWSGLTALQVGATASLSGFTPTGEGAYLSSNAYYNGSSWIYQTTATSSQYVQVGGQHRWFQAASGTAANTITFTESMRLTAAGRLLLGTTTEGSELLQVNGSASATKLFINGGTTSEFIFAAESNSSFAFGSTNGKRTGFIHSNSGDKPGLQFGYDATDNTGIIAGSTQGSGTGLDFYTYTGSSWGNRLRIDKTGAATFSSSVTAGSNVTINTSAQYPRFVVNSTYGAGSAPGITFQNSGVDKWAIAYSNSLGGVQFFQEGVGTNLLLKDGGNLALGVTPSAWRNIFTVFQVGYTGSLYALTVANGTEQVNLASNYYQNSAGSELRVQAGYATRYQQASGEHRWSTAGTSTAGSGITFTQAMTLTANGRLLLGTTTEGSELLQVAGTSKFTDAMSGTSATFSSTLSTGDDINLNYTNTQIKWASGSLRFYSTAGAVTALTIAQAGAATFSSSATATAFIPSGSSVPTNGMYLSAANTLDFATNSANRLTISSTGAATFSSLSGTGTRMVVADSSGVLSASNIVDSGEYTPTLTNVTNISASNVNTNAFRYIRVGSHVYVSGWISATATAANTTSEIGITLPIASNLGANTDLSGVSTSLSAGYGRLTTDTTNDRARLYIYPNATTADLLWNVEFSYKII